jgi:NAD(P)-dependent dehydrogenase (short-subunit alcohol dehydrogenase family)
MLTHQQVLHAWARILPVLEANRAWWPTADLDVATFDALFAANVRAPFYLVAAFAPGMAAHGHGSIIKSGSMAGSLGLAGAAAYGATKAALASLAQGWAAEFSPHGVRVDTVAAGPYTRDLRRASSSRRSGPPPR